MMMLKNTCLLLILLSHGSVKADFTFSLTLFELRNPSNRLAINNCCECCEDTSGTCTNPCQDVMLLLCLREPGHSQEDRDNCTFWELVLSDTDPRGINSPVLEQPWPGAAQLYIQVTSNGNLIDDIFIEFVFVANEPHTSRTSFTGERGLATIDINVRVACDTNYYGTDCNTFCIPMDSASGHYSCDPQDGSFVCLQGYQNELTNCIECAIGVNCSPIGGFCNNPGECICRDGFTGDNCDMSPFTSTTTEPPTVPSTSSLIVEIAPSTTTMTLMQTSMETASPTPPTESRRGNSGAVGAGVGVTFGLLFIAVALAVVVLVLILRRRGKKSRSASWNLHSQLSTSSVQGLVGANKLDSSGMPVERNNSPEFLVVSHTNLRTTVPLHAVYTGAPGLQTQPNRWGLDIGEFLGASDIDEDDAQVLANPSAISPNLYRNGHTDAKTVEYLEDDSSTEEGNSRAESHSDSDTQ